FGTGYGTSPTGEDPGFDYGVVASSTQTLREHGSSYMTIAEWVGLLGGLPFVALLAVTASNVWRVCAWMQRTADPRHYSIPLAMVVLAGLVHAAFEDWLFAVGYYVCVYFWIFAFLLADLVPDADVVPHLARRLDAETTVLLNPAMRAEFGELPNVFLIEDRQSYDASRRFVHEQTALPKLIRQSGAQVLISAGNFALWRSPVPQILLSRNSLYTSGDFFRDVRARGDYAIWADTLVKGWLARRSISRADITVAPSAAFARELSQWSGRKVLSMHHGFDLDAFASDASPLPSAAQIQLEQGKDALRLLFVSHYNYYRNFETLFKAMPILRSRLREKDKKVKLFLTCRLDSGENPGTYRAESAASLASDLRESHDIVELGTVP